MIMGQIVLNNAPVAGKTLSEQLKEWQDNEERVRERECQEKHKDCNKCDNWICKKNPNFGKTK